MKNKLLLTLSLVAAGCCAEDIKIEDMSFEKVIEISSMGYPQPDAVFFAIRNQLIFSNEVPVEKIEALLTRWFNEQPELIKSVTEVSYDPATMPAEIKDKFEQTRTINNTDIFAVMGKMVELYEQQNNLQSVDSEKDSCRPGKERCFEVVRVLKKLGVAQTLTDEQVEIAAAYEKKQLDAMG